MKLVLIATALLFYTQATETKECYSVIGTKQDFQSAKKSCEILEGKLASEDLKDGENVVEAIKAIEAFRAGIDVDPNTLIWLGISVGDMNENLSEADNPLSFSDGTKVDDSDYNMLLKWFCGQPEYTDPSYKCGYLYNNGRLGHSDCDFQEYALCTVACEDASSGSELSRANLPVFALFAAVSVFKAIYALVKPYF